MDHILFIIIIILNFLLQEFPPQSKLDSQLYGDHTSKITEQHLEPNLEGLTVNEVYVYVYARVCACVSNKYFLFLVHFKNINEIAFGCKLRRFKTRDCFS